MANPIATAFVSIRADTSGFQKDLEDKVRGSVGQVSGQLQLPIGGAGAQSAAAAVTTANQQVAASAALVTQTTAAEAAALATVQEAQVRLERATTNLAKVKVAANTTSKEIAQAEALEAAATNRLVAAEIRLGEVRAARVGVTEGAAAAEHLLAESSGASFAATSVEAAASAAVAKARIGLIDATATLALVQSNTGASASELAKAELGVVAAEDRLTAANIRLAESQVAVNNSFLANKNLSRTALQPALVGLGQGALSSRIAFFSLQGAAVALVAGGFLVAVKGAADLEQSLNTLQAVAGATAAEVAIAGTVARQLGADVTLPAVSATDAAEAILTLARTGIELQDAIAGARGVLQLAAAAQTDNATAATLAARALNAFNLAGSEATHVADLLTGASIAGGQSIQETAVALQQAGSAAAAINVPLEDTTDALALLARNGLAGSDAGTSLRTALLRMNPTTKEARSLVNALGVEVFDVRGQFIGLPAAVEQYRIALRGFTDEQKQATLQTIFGQDAFRAITLLTREGAAGFREIAETANREGIAAEIAAARTSGLKGQFQALQSNLETLGIQIGGTFIPVLTELVGALNEVVTAVTKVIHGLGQISRLKIPGTSIGIGEPLKEVAKLATPFVNTVEGIRLTSKTVGFALNEIRGEFRDTGDEAAERAAGLKKFFDGLKQIQSARAQDFVVGTPKGLLAPGNLDVLHRKIVQVGSDIATVRSISVSFSREELPDPLKQFAGKEILIPTVFDGKALEGSAAEIEQAAIARFKETGEHLGVFSAIATADAYAKTLHQQQAKLSEAAAAANKAVAEGFVLKPTTFQQGLFDIFGGQEAFLEKRRQALIRAGESIDDIGKSLRNSLRLLSALGPDAAPDVAEVFRNQIDKALFQLQRLGPEGASIMRAAASQIGNVLGPELRAAIGDFTGFDLTIDPVRVPDQIKDLIDAIDATGPEGEARLRRIGKDLTDAMAEGVEDNAEAVERARQSLNEVIAAAEQAVTDAVQSAKRNLISIGNELGGLVDEAIDAGPIGQKIKAAQDQLDRMRRGSTKSGLQFNLREARRDLTAAQQSIFTVGKPTAAQQAAIDAFLDPFKQKVTDAQSEIDQFTVEGVLTKQQENADALKTSVTQGINDIIVKYNQGAIKLGALQKGIAAILKKAGLQHYQNAGIALGTAFANKFNETVAGLITQATSIALGPKRPGSGQEPTQVDILKTAAAEAAKVEAARLALQTEQKNLQEKQRSAQVAGNAILRQIRDRLPKPQPNTTGTGDSDHKHPTKGIS